MKNLGLVNGTAGRRRSVPQQLIVKYKPDRSRVQILNAYRQNGDQLILHHPRLRYHLIRVNGNLSQAIRRYSQHPGVEHVEPNYYYHLHFIPNDQYFSLQYGLKKIYAPTAWDTTKGKASVVIAVVDTGVQSNHPDLKSKLISGYNFVRNNKNWNDDNGHGTHVAGIAAAITNNKIGVAGTAPNCRILPVKIFNANGETTLDRVLRGITYAADRGAKVINMSFGGPDYSKTLEDACNYAWAKGSVLVAAAGNSGDTKLSYPAAFKHVISVAATNAIDKKASFSTYGKWVTVAAPGEKIASTFIKSQYYYLSGTSMASPFVSGVAALLASQGRNPLQIRQVIQNSADRIGGTGTFWRYGRINARKAVRTIHSMSMSKPVLFKRKAV